MNPVVYISHRDKIPETPLDFGRSIGIIEEMLAESLRPFSIGRLVAGKRIFVKPNFVRPDYEFNPVVASDPRAVLALGKILADAGAKEVWVGDNPGVGLTFKSALKDIPWSDRWTEFGIRPFFYEDYPQLKIEMPDSSLFRRMTVPQALLDFDVFINLAKIKMHMHVGASLGIKNLYGLLCDDERMTFHRQDVNRKVVEILRRFTPDVTILEGIWALEGQAPICGEPVKDFNTIVAGTNPAAVDAVGSEIIGIEPHELATTRLAHAAGLGPMDLSEIDIKGASVGEVKRYLKRPVVSSMGAYPNCEVYELGADIGTMSSLRHALDRMYYGGDLVELPKNTFILGSPGPFYERLKEWGGDLWLIGDDISGAYGEADNIIRVPGSPPHFGVIIKALTERYWGD